MPSKALLRGPQALAAARAVAGAAAAVTGGLDVAATLRRRDSFAAHWSDNSQVAWVEAHGITLVRGRGRISAHRAVEVVGAAGTTNLRARHAVAICTGSEPSEPPIPGLAGAGAWTTKDATSAQRVPESLAVLGGGAAGCELADAWAALGSTVTLVESAPRLLPHLEEFAGDLVADGLRGRGVDVRVGVTVEGVGGGRPGPFTLHTTSGDVTATALLVSAGRRPRIADLGLEDLGLRSDDWPPVDDTCAVVGVDGEWLYAVGDVNGRALLTHQGKYQARACAAAIVGRAAGEPVEPTPWASWSATADQLGAPAVVFTNPQVGSVGRSESDARDQGITIRAVEYAIGDVAGASLDADGYVGRAKLVIDEDHSVVVGATFVGREVGELLHAATIAIVGEVPVQRLWHAVPPYPTVSEVWLRLLEAYGR